MTAATSGVGFSPTLRVGVVGRFLLPADDPAVVRHFARQLFVVHGGREWLRRLRGGVALFDRRVPLAALRAEPRAGRAIERLERALAGDGGALLARPLAAAPLRAILLLDYPGGRERLAAFLFAPRDRAPRAVLKLRPVDAPGRPLAREWQALRGLREALPRDLAETIPEALSYRADGESEALLLAALPGRSADVETRRSLVPAWLAATHLGAAADWLGRFHAATRRGPTGPDGVAAGHGDFWPRNLLLDAGRSVSGVVDWEHFEAEAPVTRDLFGFAVEYALGFPWRRFRRLPRAEAIGRALAGRGRVAGALRLYLERYAARTGLHPGALTAGLRAALRSAAAGEAP